MRSLDRYRSIKRSKVQCIVRAIPPLFPLLGAISPSRFRLSRRSLPSPLGCRSTLVRNSSTQLPSTPSIASTPSTNWLELLVPVGSSVKATWGIGGDKVQHVTSGKQTKSRFGTDLVCVFGLSSAIDLLQTQETEGSPNGQAT